MPENDEDKRNESLWKDQADDEMRLTLKEVCAKARQLEGRATREYWITLVLLGVVIAAISVYLVRFSEPMIRMGNASALATFLYIAVRWTRNGPPRKLRSEAHPDSCVNFLRTELAKKREGLLEMRWVVILLFPALVASWSAGGPVKIAEWLGIDRPWLTYYQESPAPLILFGVLLLVMWIGSGREASSIQREIVQLDGDPTFVTDSRSGRS